MQNVNFILVGESNTGKTCVVQRFTSNQFCFVYSPTIAIDFDSKQYPKVRIQIWDTSGHECYKPSMRLYAVKAHVGLCLYSANVQDWIAELQILNATILIVIVVSKRDLKSVYTQDARDFAKRNNFVFFEVSALTGFGIDTMFETCSEMILSQKQRPSALILESEESLLDRPQEHCCNIL